MNYQFIQGDALEVARTLRTNSLHCIVTSPPYYRLRDYQTATWEGGEPTCQHTISEVDRGFCIKCGATRVDQQMGLENTVNEYVTKMADLFDELKRVLHPSGVMFLNIADSYAGSGGAGGDYNAGGKKAGQPKFKGTREDTSAKPKDLLMVPEQLVLELRRRGWWLRSKIVWEKKSTMPESVRDRPTRSWEYVYLLSKSPEYYWDWYGTRQPLAGATLQDGRTARGQRGTTGIYAAIDGNCGFDSGGRNLRDVWDDIEWDASTDIWTINNSGTNEEHYATMPVALAERCIQAGSSEHGVCRSCGSPWERILSNPGGLPLEDEPETQGRLRANGTIAGDTARRVKMSGKLQAEHRLQNPIKMLGWQPTCKCQDSTPVSALVYDPFMGIGTTALAALRLGRAVQGSELGAKYLAIAERRIKELEGISIPRDEKLPTLRMLDLFAGAK